jgi:hypothetical protein
MVAELGKCGSVSVDIENPDGQPMAVRGTCTNQTVFFYEPEGTITVPPLASKKLKLVYRPSSL